MSLVRGLVAQFEVVHAITMRETRTRFGRHQLGYLWALVEPSLMILTFYVLFIVAHRRPPAGMDIFGFLATGIIPFTLFQNAANRVAESINANKGLLFYPHVQPLDLVYARGLLELATFMAVFVVLMTGSVLARQELVIDSALQILSGLVLAGALGIAVGLVFCGLGQMDASADRARGPIMRPLFWVSGVFFTAGQLPDRAQEIMLYNPVLHVTELVRDGWYVQYDSPHASVPYVLLWILFFTAVGLSLERVVRRRIELT